MPPYTLGQAVCPSFVKAASKSRRLQEAIDRFYRGYDGILAVFSENR